MERIEFSDEKLVCVDCGKTFVFTSGEAAFFWSKQLDKPKRCPECRRLRRERLIPKAVQND